MVAPQSTQARHPRLPDVIATIEGHAQRKLFEATVEGPHAGLPAGRHNEQILVQEIAACFWRKRRLLMFENRAGLRRHRTAAAEIVELPPTR